jgi:hypothetical protein
MLSDLIIQQIDNVCVMRKINKIISHKKLFIEFLLIYIIAAKNDRICFFYYVNIFKNNPNKPNKKFRDQSKMA